MKARTITAIQTLVVGMAVSSSAQVNITSYGYGVPTTHTTLTPTYGGYQATTYGIGVPTTHSFITTPGYGFDYRPVGGGIQSSPNRLGPIDSSTLIGKPSPVVTPEAVQGLSDAFRTGWETSSYMLDRSREAAKARQQAEIEYVAPAAVEARRQAELVRLEEAKIRRQTAETQLEILKLQREATEKKAKEQVEAAQIQQQRNATPEARRAAQLRYDRIAAQVQAESAAAKARREKSLVQQQPVAAAAKQQ
jgi:hypothetical protein